MQSTYERKAIGREAEVLRLKLLRHFYCYVYVQFVCHEAHENSVIDMNNSPYGEQKVHRLIFGFLFALLALNVIPTRS